MSSVVVVGTQWGDEGKGKLVDYLTSNADMVVRFQGGNNAGHTLVVDGKKTQLSVIPSGILREHTKCLIGAGVVLNTEVFLQEVAKLQAAGVSVSPERLVIDRDAHVILDYHKALDTAKEEARGDNKIGTTGRGIGPCYQDRAGRVGVRLADLFYLDQLKDRLMEETEGRNAYLKDILKSTVQVDFSQMWEKLKSDAEKVLPYVGNVSLILDRALQAEQKVVFEGAQGTLLDQAHGTIPFVTSSNTISGSATTGCGIGPKRIDYILGVTKAYTTRVGSGPFPTELNDPVGQQLREAGGEFGTVTGRPRRCGWFDTVAMKRAVRLNGLDSLAITKLDVLSGLDKIKICINYHLNGEKVEDVPALASELSRVEPEYIELDGWNDDLSQVKKWHQLPSQARLYLSTLSEIIGCPISIVSVGPERDSTLFLKSAGVLKNFVNSEEEDGGS
ncbi:MAG: adenylosuccinate synthase [Bdellovibrionales bacterium]|nr:adenylosuccinate synthase [Bdellovibrionales bacterium]